MTTPLHTAVTAVTFSDPATPLSLDDIQNKPDSRGIALPAAGIRRVRMPLSLLQKDGTPQTVAAEVSMAVNLPAEQKGTHMSRFVIQLAQWSDKQVFSIYLQDFLQELRQRLNATEATIEVLFPYFMQKAAPVTGQSAPMAYDCRFRGRLTPEGLTLTLRVQVPIATLCPCSKAISDFGAHNQRALLVSDLTLKADHEAAPLLWIEDVVALADEAATCPVFPLLKRADEKWVTERQYTNAKFVEDVVRDMALLLRQQAAIGGFRITCEALESIHDHNAWAGYAEGDTEAVFY